MAASCCSASSSIDLTFLRPEIASTKLRFSLSRRNYLRKLNRTVAVRDRIRIRSVRSDEVVLVEKEDGTVDLGGNGSYKYINGVENGRNLNGSVVGEDESLVKYVNGNGNGNGGIGVKIGEDDVEKKSEKKKKKTIEEIGQEDAWFKRSGGGKVEVSVAPGGRWNRFKTYSTIQRTFEIWGFVLSFLFKAWFNNQKFAYRGGMTEQKKVQRRKTLAKWLKESILRLGPTFIKIGQQFSTRVDILAQEYVDQLSELQDQVPPFPSETAVSIIEEELGAPVNEVFDYFDFEPIAAASLGQVHRARLKGQELVVKVQRPGLKDLFDIDLKNLRVIAENLQKLDPKSDGAKRDWVAIYDECANVLYQEIDYTKEAANAVLFANNFKDLDYVKVPNIYWKYTTPQVLTMEYVPGIKINRIQALDQLGVDRKKLGRYAVESYLEQILSHGFFHADPQVMLQLGLQVRPQSSVSQPAFPQHQANYASQGRGRGSHNRGRGNRNNSRNYNNNHSFNNSNGGHRNQFSWASNQNMVFGTCNRCGIGHIPSQCPNRDLSTLRSPPSANFANYRSEETTNWLPDTGCNGHSAMDQHSLAHSEPYFAIDHVVNSLSSTFALQDMGALSYFLGIEVKSAGSDLILSQRKYILEILKKAGLLNSKPVTSPCSITAPLSLGDSPGFDNPVRYRQVVGALQYLTLTRPDIAFAVNKVCQYMHSPTVNQWSAVKRILRYLQGTLNQGLLIKRSSGSTLHAYTDAHYRSLTAYSDADWAGCPDDRRSTGGYAIYLGSNLVSWSARKQRNVSRSSTESEYKALADTVAELTWLDSLMRELRVSLKSAPILWCDNLGATYLSANPIFHARTKHVEVDFHFVREKVAQGRLSVQFISTHDQIADIFTKPLPTDRFVTLRDKLQLVSHA